MTGTWTILQHVEWEGPGLIASEAQGRGVHTDIRRLDLGLAFRGPMRLGAWLSWVVLWVRTKQTSIPFWLQNVTSSQNLFGRIVPCLACVWVPNCSRERSARESFEGMDRRSVLDSSN